MNTNDPFSDDGIRQLADAIYWDKVRRARQRSPVEKLLDGPRLFDFGCEIMVRDPCSESDVRPS